MNRLPFRMLNFKVKSFTLAEIVVAMALTSIVLLIAYSAYRIINRQFVEYKNTSEVVKGIYQFIDVLEEDLEDGEVVVTLDDQVIINKDGGVVKYGFGDNYILREWEEVRDTVISNEEVKLVKGLDDGEFAVVFEVLGNKVRYAKLKRPIPE